MAESIFPQIRDLTYAERDTARPADTRSPTFDFRAGDFVLANRAPKIVHGADRVQTWIDKLLRTELDVFAVYEITPELYGCEWPKWFYSTREREYIRAELSREIRQKMQENPEITDVRDITVTFERHTCRVSYSVTTVYGDTGGEISA